MESVNEEIRVVSEDIGDHKVLVVTKGNKTVLLDTMYDENAFFSEWIQEQHIPNSMGLKVILFGLGNGLGNLKDEEWGSFERIRKPTRIDRAERSRSWI